MLLGFSYHQPQSNKLLGFADVLNPSRLFWNSSRGSKAGCPPAGATNWQVPSDCEVKIVSYQLQCLTFRFTCRKCPVDWSIWFQTLRGPTCVKSTSLPFTSTQTKPQFSQVLSCISLVYLSSRRKKHRPKIGCRIQDTFSTKSQNQLRNFPQGGLLLHQRYQRYHFVEWKGEHMVKNFQDTKHLTHFSPCRKIKNFGKEHPRDSCAALPKACTKLSGQFQLHWTAELEYSSWDSLQEQIDSRFWKESSSPFLFPVSVPFPFGIMSLWAHVCWDLEIN